MNQNNDLDIYLFFILDTTSTKIDDIVKSKNLKDVSRNEKTMTAADALKYFIIMVISDQPNNKSNDVDYIISQFSTEELQAQLADIAEISFVNPAGGCDGLDNRIQALKLQNQLLHTKVEEGTDSPTITLFSQAQQRKRLFDNQLYRYADKIFSGTNSLYKKDSIDSKELCDKYSDISKLQEDLLRHHKELSIIEKYTQTDHRLYTHFDEHLMDFKKLIDSGENEATINQEAEEIKEEINELILMDDESDNGLYDDY